MAPRVHLPAALVAALLVLAAGAAAAPGARLVQAESSPRGLVLESAPGRATVASAEGRRQRLPLRRGEELEAFAETASGWVAAGVRPTRDGYRLALVVDGSAGVERLPEPPDAEARLRVRPVPLASARRFEGLAWLEGDRPAGFAVRAAEWSGAGWAPAEEISPPRAGGQAGLVGAILADGSWLLVWSAADGGDSELLWARRRGRRWSEPRRLAPAAGVPDAMPTLVPLAGGGALVAWSRIQGGTYRLLTARFDGGSWSAPRPAGPPAAIEARFAARPDGIFLVYRRGSPTGWAVLGLDDRGAVRRYAALATARRERPALGVDRGTPVLRWERRDAGERLRWEARP